MVFFLVKFPYHQESTDLPFLKFLGSSSEGIVIIGVRETPHSGRRIYAYRLCLWDGGCTATIPSGSLTVCDIENVHRNS